MEVNKVNPTIAVSLSEACDIATGKMVIDPNAEGAKIVGAKKDLNGKGNGPYWFRMVWRDKSWQYVSEERLPNGNFLASDRRAIVYGQAYHGEIVVSHDRGKPVDIAWIIDLDKKDDVKHEIPFVKTRDRHLLFTLPNGEKIKLPDPRSV